jgi:hypothetical protein
MNRGRRVGRGSAARRRGCARRLLGRSWTGQNWTEGSVRTEGGDGWMGVLTILRTIRSSDRNPILI